MFINETRITVRYAETDQMGIVHHSNYYVYFEEARTQFIKKCGMSYTQMEQNGIMMPLVESSCKYKIAAKYEDELIIKTWLKELSPIKAEFHYSVIRVKDQRELSLGSTIHAFVDHNFKIINLKKHNPEIYHSLQTLAQ